MRDWMRTRRGPIFGLALVILLMAGAAWAWSTASREMHRPLGPTLNPTFTSPAETEPLAEVGVAKRGDTQPEPTQRAAPSPEAEPETATAMCAGPDQMIILAVGADNKTGYGGGHADAIRVVRADFVTASVSILALPRDTWIPIPRLEEQEITEGRLSHAYHWGGVFLGRKQGPSLLADTLHQNFGLSVDHYFAINKRNFARAINALGGVDVCLPEPIYRWTTDKPYLEEGCSRLSGAEAMWLNRIRVPYSDLQRIQHQNHFLTELMRTALRPATLTALPELFSSFREGVLTDLSVADIASLSCLLPKIEADEIEFYTLDADLLTPVTRQSGAQIFEPDIPGVRAYVDAFLDGQLPGDED